MRIMFLITSLTKTIPAATWLDVQSHSSCSINLDTYIDRHVLYNAYALDNLPVNHFAFKFNFFFSSRSYTILCISQTDIPPVTYLVTHEVSITLQFTNIIYLFPLMKHGSEIALMGTNPMHIV